MLDVEMTIPGRKEPIRLAYFLCFGDDGMEKLQEGIPSIRPLTPTASNPSSIIRWVDFYMFLASAIDFDSITSTAVRFSDPRLLK